MAARVGSVVVAAVLTMAACTSSTSEGGSRTTVSSGSTVPPTTEAAATSSASSAAASSSTTAGRATTTTVAADPAVVAFLARVAGGRPADAAAVACAMRAVAKGKLPDQLATAALSTAGMQLPVRAAFACHRTAVLDHLGAQLVASGAAADTAPRSAESLLSVLQASSTILDWYLSGTPLASQGDLRDVALLGLKTACPTCSDDQVEGVARFLDAHPPLDQQV